MVTDGLRVLSLRKAILVTLCLLLPAACTDTSSMPGDIASVNGEGISFREVEARRVNQFTGLSPQGKTFNDESLQEQYRYIVQQIAEELIICQFMEKKDMSLDPGVLEAEEKTIRDDYPDGSFEDMLVSDGINIDLWRESLRRRLMINLFLTQVLRPEITITSEEVQQYYTEHSSEFVIPEQWHFMQITGLDKKEVESARNNFLASKNATAVQKEFPVTMHDIRMGKDRLPDAVNKELAPLAPWKSAPVKPFENEFRVFVLMEKVPSTMLDAAEMYKRVEQALAEDKLQSVYADWMSKRLLKADIRLAPALLPMDAAKAAPLANGTAPLVPPAGNGTGAGAPASHNGTADPATHSSGIEPS